MGHKDIQKSITEATMVDQVFSRGPEHMWRCCCLFQQYYIRMADTRQAMRGQIPLAWRTHWNTAHSSFLTRGRDRNSVQSSRGGGPLRKKVCLQHLTGGVVTAVVTDSSSSSIVFIWLVISCHIVMTREGVAVTLARPAVHWLELVTWPEWLVIVEGCTTLALTKDNYKPCIYADIHFSFQSVF